MSKTRINSRGIAGAALALTLGLVVATAGTLPDVSAKPRASKAWRKIAAKLRSSVKAEAKADFLLATARASLLADEDERDEAMDDAKDEFKETKALAKDQYDARLELALTLGEKVPYSVDIDPADFVQGIDNPYLPYTVGSTWTYEADTEDGLETIVVTVLAETKTILGVECVVVRDTVTIDGVLLEDTHDWYAQHKNGDVWYMGEISLNYDENGQITDVDGSWESGVDGAHPGIVMLADPVSEVGRVYRQEFLLGEAEDWAEVLAFGESVSVAAGDYDNCIRTLDALTIEPDALEHKSYAPGVGLVLEVEPESGERVELISFVAGP